jgi:hypothetical protein
MQQFISENQNVNTIGYRILALEVFAERASLEDYWQMEETTEEQRNAFMNEYLYFMNQLKKADISPAFSYDETETMEKTLGQWDGIDWESAEWLDEKMGTLLWYCSKINAWPSPENEFNLPEEVVTWNDVLHPDRFIKILSPRSEDELAEVVELTRQHLWHAFTRLYDKEDYVENTDLTVNGLSYSEMKDEQVYRIAILNATRLGVLNWIYGNEDWDYPNSDC